MYIYTTLFSIPTAVFFESFRNCSFPAGFCYRYGVGTGTVFRWSFVRFRRFQYRIYRSIKWHAVKQTTFQLLDIYYLRRLTNPVILMGNALSLSAIFSKNTTPI